MEVYTILFNRLISESAKKKASDLHLSVGSVPIIRKDGRLIPLEGEKITEQETLGYMVNSFLDEKEQKLLAEKKEITTVKKLGGNLRFKINVYYQKKLLAASFRLITSMPSDFSALQLPNEVSDFARLASGLVVVAGPYGSGKTSTLGAIIENINKTQKKRILTLEKPVEILFVSKQSIIEQREVGVDVNSLVEGLRYSKNEDIDVLMVSDFSEEFAEAMPMILEIASGNCLALLELNADSVTRVVAKILDSFPANKTEAARALLADVLGGVVVQKLLLKIGGGMAMALEIVTAAGAVRQGIRAGKIQQLQTIMQTSGEAGMMSMNKSLINLVQSGQISREDAVANSTNKEDFAIMIK